MCSGNAENDLSSKKALAENILKLAELCRKMETEQEKVMPFKTITAVPVGVEDKGARPGSLRDRMSPPSFFSWYIICACDGGLGRLVLY